MIPAKPDSTKLADACREIAGRERLQPVHVEKDFNLTRLIWSISEKSGSRLLLKGGTCLSKVDYEFHRMSEDADFVFPRQELPSGRDQAAKVMGPLRQSIRRAAEAVGARLTGQPRLMDKSKFEAIFTVEYDSSFEANNVGTIYVEIGVRPVIRSPRKVGLRHLLSGPLANGYDDAYCWALDADEVRAEKIRAAFTRNEIRDFYDLQLFVTRKSDLNSGDFRALVDLKLKELDTAPLARQHINFGKSNQEIRDLEASIDSRLAVVRVGETRFKLVPVLTYFNDLWQLRT